jgi:hypothetical protein
LLTRARALVPANDQRAATELAAAEAWDVPDCEPLGNPERAPVAVEMARALDDPVLLSNALDALGAVAVNDGRLRDAAAMTRERVGMIARYDHHDPRTGGEIIDTLHMGMEHAVAIGDLHEARRVAALARSDEVGRTITFLTTSRMVIPLALMGDFDGALTEAVAMRSAWERAGEPTASWMGSAALAAAMVCGLRGESDGFAQWRAFARVLSSRPTVAGFLPFVDARIALHHGRLDEAVDALATIDRVDDYYDAYALGLRAEVTVVAGAADADEWVEQHAALAARENDWAAACVERAKGRLHGDAVALQRALDGFDAVGARFEWACTALLLDDESAAAGRAVFEELRCPFPVAPTAGAG